MAEEVKGKDGEPLEAPKEGTVEAEIIKDAPKKEETVVIEDKKAPETVPLSVYLALKDDVKELRKEIQAGKTSEKSAIIVEGVDKLADKYPDVKREFLVDIITSAKKLAKDEIDEKYAPIIQKQDEEKKQKEFDRAFDKVFDQAIKENPELPRDIDKEAIKTLAVTPAYRNTPVSEILIKLYGGVDTGKSTTENDTRTAGDAHEDVIDFEKMTNEQRDKVLDDPKARKAYFKYLDSK